MVVCSATLHSFEVKKLAEALMHFPTWVDLKGQDSVPDTVHHVVLNCNPKLDSSWANVRNPTPTDRVHERDRVGPGVDSPGKPRSPLIEILKNKTHTRKKLKLQENRRVYAFLKNQS